MLQTFRDRMLAKESTNWLKCVAEGDAHVEMQSFKQNGLSLTRSLPWHCQLVWVRLSKLIFVCIHLFSKFMKFSHFARLILYYLGIDN